LKSSHAWPGPATVAALLAFVAVGWLVGADTHPARSAAGDPAKGKKIFSVKCIACHKPDGSGGVKVTTVATPDWRDSTRMADPKFDDAYLRDCITNGRPKSGMVAWSKQGVKAGDIENLIAYIRTFSKAAGPSKTKSSAAKPE
jgi:cytochrome c oxidase cbb3-type subunit 3